jgi:hypothetical protein
MYTNVSEKPAASMSYHKMTRWWVMNNESERTWKVREGWFMGDAFHLHARVSWYLLPWLRLFVASYSHIIIIIIIIISQFNILPSFCLCVYVYVLLVLLLVIMLTLAFGLLAIKIELLLLLLLLLLLYICKCCCFFFLTHANFVIGLWAVSFVRK